MTIEKLKLISVCISVNYMYWLLYVCCLHNVLFDLELHTHNNSFHGKMHFTSSSNFSILLLMPPEKFKKGEIEVKSNPAYDTVTLPNPPVTQVHTKPCAAYAGVVHVHH